MAGIEAPEYQVNVSQENLINKFAVQGEENSRMLTLHLVENVQTENALQQTEIRQKPLDLTGCTARLYTKKPDGNATFTNGTIVAYGADGNANTVTFVLTQQTTAAAGDAHCTVAVFGSNGTELKATGITLDIAADDMEQTIVSTSEFVSLAEALNKAESAEKIAEDSASEISKTVSAANTELNSLKTQASDITTAESSRVTAESGRVTAEQGRATAEQARASAETVRSDAESQRKSNESARQTAETARAAAESSRAEAEGKRVATEQNRVTAEAARVDAEGKRVTAETTRVNAESARQTSETARVDAEGKRASAETSRADAEAARATAEQARQTAESSRQTAEAARETASQTAVSNADTATTRANNAAKAAEDVVAGDIGTAVDQRIAAKTNIAGGIAGYDSMQTALAGKANTTDLTPYQKKSENPIPGLKSGTTLADTSCICLGKGNAVTGNTDNDADNTVSGGYNNTISGGDHNTISGSYNTINAGTFSTISGGASNTISGIYNTINAGVFNTISGRYSTISGIEKNVISGGTLNTINAGSYNTINAGEGNTISGGENNTISGGGVNTISGGNGSKSYGFGQNVWGQCNKDPSTTNTTSFATTNDALIIGNGTSDTARSNCFRVKFDGSVYGLSAFNSSGADYSEFFEWFDENPNKEDRVGRFVALDGEKIRCAKPNDDVLGIVSALPAIIGDSPADSWKERYVTDVFGRRQTEEVTIPAELAVLDENGVEVKPAVPEHTETRFKVNPNYDPTQEDKYENREKRPEWSTVGMIGKLVLIDDGTCTVNSYAQPAAAGDGTATKSDTKTNCRVMTRLDSTHIKVLLK